MIRSLITLKALTYAPTGGIVAAPTTSLPEKLGGVRNWDYRFCWLRDATITLQALMYAGFEEEARDWRRWLLRAIAGDPAEVQIMYGVAGERRLPEYMADWLPGYDGNPVRIGNQAVDQFQLDVYGEVMDALYQARTTGLQRRRQYLGAAEVADEDRGGTVAGPGRGNLGGARRSAAFHPLEVDGLGRCRPGGAQRGEVRARRADRAMARASG